MAYHLSEKEGLPHSQRFYGWLFHPSLRAFIQNYNWIHLTLGLIGNTAFFVGSIFFLWEKLKPAGIWLFIIGSLGMLLGSIGHGVVLEEEKHQRLLGKPNQ